MSRFPDLIGREFGYLKVVAYAGKQRKFESGEPQRYWECRCTFCGGSISESTAYLVGGRTWHCENCDPPRGDDYLTNYEHYRANFTPKQRRLYEEIMQTRKGRRAEAEAVDLVMRETRNEDAA
jgi:hypothetical protein